MTIELGVVVKADGTVELSNGMALGAASVGKLAGALDGLDAATNQSGKELRATGRDAEFLRGEMDKLRVAGVTKVNRGEYIELAKEYRVAKQAAKELADQQNESARTAARAAATAAREVADANTAMAKASNVARIQNLQLSAQLQDFFVQVQAGQSPLTAFIQQGSQLSFVYGSAGNAFRAVTALITPARVAMAGFAGAVGAVAFASAQGYLEQRELVRSLVMTGTAAGQTIGQLDSLAQRISTANNTSVAGSREALAGLVATGRFGASSLESVATVIEKVTALSGRARGDVIKEFSAMAKDGPTKFAEEANKSYNFLTLAQYRYVKELEDQGRASQAMVVVADALNARLGTMSSNLGTLEKAWHGTKTAASDFWDVLKGIGKEQTPEGALASLQKQQELAGARRAQLGVNVGRDPYANEIEAARETVRLAQRSAALKGEEAEKQKTLINQQKEHTKRKEETLDRQVKLNNELKKAREDAAATGNLKDLPAIEKGLREKYKGPDQTASIKQLAEAQYASARAAMEGVAGIERRMADERLRTNEQLYRLGLIDVRRYYEEKTALELASLDVQQSLIAGEIAQAKITQAKATKEADKIAAGTRVAQLENQLAELQGRKDETRTNNSYARALALKQELDEIQKRMDDYDQRAAMAMFQQQLAGKDRIEDLKIGQIKDPQAREEAMLEKRRRKMEEIANRATRNEEDRLDALKTINEEMRLENDLLVEKFKPGWQKMLEEWGNTNRLIKDSYNNAINGALRSGENEWVRSHGNLLSTSKAMLSSLRDELNRFIYQNTIGQLFGGIFGGGGGSRGSGGGGFLGSIFSGTSFNPFGATGGGGSFDIDIPGWLASIFHTGIGPNERGSVSRNVPASTFANAPRFHTGVGPGERAAIIREDEGVFTPGQMRALAPVGRSGSFGAGGGSGDVKINLINQSGQELEAQGRRKDDGTIEVILRQVQEAVASGIANGDGPVYGAMQSRFGLRTAVA